MFYYFSTTGDATYIGNGGTTSANYLDYLDNGGTSTSAAGGFYFPYQQKTFVPYIIPYQQIQQSSSRPVLHNEHDEENIREENIREENERKLKEAAKAAAEDKARTLLLEHLDDENKQRYTNKKPLEVISKLFNDIKYRVPISGFGRIQAYKDDNIVSELCVVVKEDLPINDIILTKFLYVLNDEENMLRIANHSNVKENLLERLN